MRNEIALSGQPSCVAVAKCNDINSVCHVRAMFNPNSYN